MGNEQGKQAAPTTAGIQSMDESLQKKFSKGIQYNMKIVVRGDRNTGKSCLFHRMEGRSFNEGYAPTNEIQVTSILWSYKVTNDTVKVEVWDVVDKGKVQRKESKGLLKLFNQPAEQQETSDIPLDADFLDVYKGAHGVVFMFDITKQWTWRYVEKELPKVPLHIPVMVLASFSDMREHRVVSKEECRSCIELLDRPEGAAQVRYAEASMKDGFGLMHLHKFLSVPFLQLQQETLLHQLQVNREQMLAASEELDGAVNTEDQNYDLHLSKIQKLSDERKRKAQEEQAAEVTGDESPMSPLRRSNSNPSPRSPRTPMSAAESPKFHRASDSPQVERSGSFSKLTSRISSFLSKRKEESKKEQPVPIVPKRQPRRPASSSNVDDFMPEGEVDTKFFGGEDGEEEEEEEDEEDSEEGESEEDVKNPQVAMDEDLSSQEEGSAPPTSVAIATPPTSRPQQREIKPKSPPIKLKSAKDIVLTESEEEDPDFPGTMPAQPKVTPKSKQDGDVFSTSTPKSPPTKKTSKGLLLEFNLPSSQGSAQAKPKPADSPSSKPRERKSSKTDSPSEPRERKRRKSKKSRHKEEESGGGLPAAPPPTSEDPFGLTTSLDAWLNAGTEESNKLGKVLLPSQVGSTDKGAEVGVVEEEDGGHHHHHKKHKHRSSRQEAGSTHKKHKHRSKHSHKEQPPGHYEVL